MRIVAQESMPPGIEAKIQERFNAADKNKDSRLTLTEAKDGLPSRVWENFDRIDADKSGTIDMEEIRQAFINRVIS